VEWLHDVVGGTYRKIAGKSEDNWVWSPQWVVDMHRPELWGYVQFSSRKPGEAAFMVDPAWEVKSILHDVYYAQRAFRDSTTRWAQTLDQLRLGTPAVSAQQQGLSLQTAGDGFVATMPLTLPNGTTRRWHIRQDARIWKD
jgi:hypothetical protein